MDHRDARWANVHLEFLTLADKYEATGQKDVMSACWGVINFIDHDQDSHDITNRLSAIAKATKAIAALPDTLADLSRLRSENERMRDCLSWLLFHAERGRRWKTVAHRGLDFTDDEFEGRIRAALEGRE